MDKFSVINEKDQLDNFYILPVDQFYEDKFSLNENLFHTKNPHRSPHQFRGLKIFPSVLDTSLSNETLSSEDTDLECPKYQSKYLSGKFSDCRRTEIIKMDMWMESGWKDQVPFFRQQLMNKILSKNRRDRHLAKSFHEVSRDKTILLQNERKKSVGQMYYHDPFRVVQDKKLMNN